MPSVRRHLAKKGRVGREFLIHLCAGVEHIRAENEEAGAEEAAGGVEDGVGHGVAVGG